MFLRPALLARFDISMDKGEADDILVYLVWFMTLTKQYNIIVYIYNIAFIYNLFFVFF